MLSKILKARTLLAALVLLAAIAVLINRNATVSVHAGGSTAVIVEMRDDPGAVYKARTEKSGVMRITVNPLTNSVTAKLV